jgi:DNA-binding NtrC family response regulator
MSAPSILHVSSRDLIRVLRDEILRLQGYHVTSTLSIEEAEALYKQSSFDLVIVDVEGDGRIPLAEKLCDDIRKMNPDQKIAFICNYRVSKTSDCPNEIIHSEFNPKALVEGIKDALA